MSKNPYEVLGVAKNANDAEIKSAYRKLVMKHHPDKNAGNKAAEEKFKDVNNAYDILKDPQKRAAYDRFGDAAFAGGNGASAGGGNPFGNMGGGGFHFDMGGMGGMEDILKQAMRGFGFDMGDDEAPGRGTGSHAGRDLLDEISLSLSEAYFGKSHTVKFTANTKCEKCNGFGTADGKEAPICARCHGRGVIFSRRGLFMSESACPDCNGLGRTIKKKCSACDGTGVRQESRTIEIKIPAGVMDGTRLQFKGQGEAGMLNGQPGDFFVDVRVRPDSRFTRRGADLFAKATVSFPILAMGGKIKVDTIDDKGADLDIPAGTQVGERLKVRGKGMPNGRGGFGDLFIETAIDVPKSLTEKQKKALQEFADAPSKKGWF